MPFQGAIVKMRNHALHGVALVAGAGGGTAERLGRVAVGVNEIGIVIFHHVQDAQRPLRGIPMAIIEVVGEDARAWAPITRGRRANALVFVDVLVVKPADVVILPPGAGAVRRGHGVVGNAGESPRTVAQEIRLGEPPAVFMVERHAHVHSQIVDRIGPFRHRVALGTEVHHVPWIVTRVPIVEVVVMHALHQHEPRAGVVKQLRHPGGTVVRRRPSADNILVAVGGRVAEIISVKIVGVGALLIHVLGGPVAALEIRLRAVVKPDAELRLPQPRGRAVAGDIRRDGRPRRRERPVGLDGEIHVHFRECRRIAHRHGIGRRGDHHRQRRQSRQRVGVRSDDRGGKQSGNGDRECSTINIHLIINQFLRGGLFQPTRCRGVISIQP